MQVKAIAGAAMLAALAAPEAYAQTAAATAGLRPFVWTPSVTVKETYTDNVELTEAGRKGDFITEAVLGIDASYNGPRLNAELTASAGYSFFANTSSLNGVSFSGFGTGAFAVVPNTLTIEAAGQVQNRMVSTFRQSAVDRTTRQDRIQIGIYSIGPHLTTPVGRLADLDVSATVNAVNFRPADSSTTTFVPDDSVYSEIKGTLTTGDRLDRFELELAGTYLEDDHDFTEASGVATAYYAVTPSTRVFGRVGHDSVEQANIVDLSTSSWSVGTEFRFRQGSYFRLEGGRRYDRPSYDAEALLQISQRLYLTAAYNEQLQPPQVSLGRNLNAFVDLPAAPPTFDTGQPLILGNLVNETSLQKEAVAHLIYRWPQQSIDWAMGWTDREMLQTRSRDRTYATGLTWRRELRVDMAVEVEGRYNRTYANFVFNENRSYGGAASLIYRLRPTTQISAVYAYIDDKQLSGPRTRIYENIISIALRKQF